MNQGSVLETSCSSFFQLDITVFLQRGLWQDTSEMERFIRRMGMKAEGALLRKLDR
jgi:hypothetical protein